MAQSDDDRKFRDPYENPEPLAGAPWCCDRPRIQLCACLEHSACGNCGDGLPCGDDCLFPIPCPECGNPDSEDWRECAASGCATTRENQEK